MVPPDGTYGADPPLADGGAAPLGAGQEKDGFLDIRGQDQQGGK